MGNFHGVVIIVFFQPYLKTHLPTFAVNILALNPKVKALLTFPHKFIRFFRVLLL